MKILILTILSFALASQAADPINLGLRWELFVDEHLVSEKNGVALKLHEPVKREIVLTTDQPWEGQTCAYFSVIQDGGKVMMYYRGSSGGSDHSDAQVTCVAESTDGIHFTRPKLGLIEAGGTKDNNVIWRGVESHNFSPFLDANPKANPEERYKALGGVKQPGKNWHQGETPGGLYAFASADGIHWKKMKDEPVITKGAFDSQNLAFYDTTRDRYVCFSRIFINKVRAVQSNTSTDFLGWTEPAPHVYAEGVPWEHFYTSATVPCPTAPHLFLSFPKRYVTNRKKVPDHEAGGVSDAVFMSSRDGVHWDRPFLEAWSRPGPDLKNWTDRNNMTANGIVVTGEGEWSLYISEHYRHEDHRIRRLTVRKQGFASMHGDAKGGSFTTKPIIVSGPMLYLNYATSAAGSLGVEVLDEAGKVVAELKELYGDEFEAPALDLSALKGKAVRLRVSLKDADLYALRFSEAEPPGIQHLVAVKDVCAWPALTSLPDGSINATLFSKPSHGQVAGAIEVWNSADGTAWIKRGIPAPNDPDTNRMNHAAGLAKNGDLIVLVSGWTNVKQPQRPKQGDFRDDILSTWVCRSADGGKTWTQIKDFPAPDGGWSHYIPFGDIKQGEDGALHVSCYGGEFTDPSQSTKTKGYRSWHFRSDDDGKTWKRISTIHPTGNETTLLHLGGKRWLAASRERAMDLFWSEDDGVTWSEPLRVTALNEINGHLVRLRDGRLVLSHGCRVKERFGVLAKLSSDEGRTWTEPFRIATSLEGDCGYPSTVQRADGKLVTAWYAKATPLYASYHMGVSIWEAPKP